jgi:WD40 repeat protein
MGTFLTQGSRGNVRAVAFSPDGSRIMLATDAGVIKIWQTLTGKQMPSITLNEQHITSCAFSPQGNYIITTSEDDLDPKIWDAQSGALLQRLVGHVDIVIALAFSSNEQLVATGSWDGTAKIWNRQTGALIRSIDLGLGQGHTVWSATFSPNSKFIITGSDTIARIWNVEDGQLIHAFPKQASFVNSVQFSPDGNYVVATSGKTATIWNATKNFELLYTIKDTHMLKSALFSLNDLWVLTVSIDGTTKIFDISKALINNYFSNKLLPLKQQSLSVTLDALSRQKNGRPIKKSDLVADPRQDTSALFKGIPQWIIDALKRVYKIDEDVFI